jgi:hypothetical protein
MLQQWHQSGTVPQVKVTWATADTEGGHNTAERKLLNKDVTYFWYLKNFIGRAFYPMVPLQHHVPHYTYRRLCGQPSRTNQVEL